MAELYIGLMSGTSMDGVDAVVAEFGKEGMHLHGSHSEPMPAAIRHGLIELTQPGPNEIDRMGELDVQVGQLFAQAALKLLDKAGLKPADIQGIGSHGQTIRHRPQVRSPFSLQIGDPNTIAETTGLTVVADFRRRDMAAGGQGAPLVPAFHQYLFHSEGLDRVIVNLGGIANISVLRRDLKAPVYGFDTGPANGLMDAWHQRHLGQAYDEDGHWAASGTVDASLLARLLAHPFFALPAPKSTGREDFHLEWLLAQLQAHGQNLPPADVQATLLELTAQSLATAIHGQGLNEGELILCGGGAYNKALWQRLDAVLPGFQQRSSADFGLAPTWVEASAFAWLACRTLQGLPGNLPSVTGARGPRILGGVYPG
jgi:anhydro-N-acetylmuramic acid kinase